MKSKAPELGRFHRGGDGAVARDHDDRRHLDDMTQPLQHLEAVHARHLDVEEHQVRRFALGLRNALFAGRRRQDVVALVLEDHLQRVADRGFVVDDEDAWLHRGSIRTVRMFLWSMSGM